MLELSNVWHGRLGHVNFNTMCRWVILELLPKFHIDKDHKCETCVKAKMIKKPFPNVVRNSNLLDLIHSDLCELNGILTRGGKCILLLLLMNIVDILMYFC